MKNISEGLPLQAPSWAPYIKTKAEADRLVWQANTSELRTVVIDIPANATGTLSVLVSDGQRLTQAEQRESRSQQPRSVPQLIRTLNKTRRNDTIYVKLLGSDPGAVVNGELLSSLPPSVLAVLEADRSAGDFVPLRNATLGEWDAASANTLCKP